MSTKKSCYQTRKKKALIRPAHHQLTMLNAFDCRQLIRQFRQAVGRSHHRHYMQAKILIDIILGRRQDHILIILLDTRDFQGDLFLDLVIHDHDRPGYDMVALPFTFGYILLYQKTNRLRTIGEAILITSY